MPSLTLAEIELSSPYSQEKFRFLGKKISEVSGGSSIVSLRSTDPI
ncbi:MAG: hypothetical protein WA882_06385 [Geitlerinemataceae cyanobacterium]